MTPERLRELWASGTLLETIAREAGLSRSAISKRAKTMGLPSRKPPPAPPNSSSPRPKVNHAEIVAMHHRGVPGKEIAVALGCSAATVYRITARLKRDDGTGLTDGRWVPNAYGIQTWVPEGG